MKVPLSSKLHGLPLLPEAQGAPVLAYYIDHSFYENLKSSQRCQKAESWKECLLMAGLAPLESSEVLRSEPFQQVSGLAQSEVPPLS